MGTWRGEDREGTSPGDRVVSPHAAAEAGVTRGDLCPSPLAVPAALAPAHKLQIKNCPALIKGIWAGTRHLLLCPDQLGGTAG